MNVGVILQARIGSTRLPKKSVLPFYENFAITELIINRLKENLSIPIILATTDSKNDDVLENLAKENGVKFYRGNEQDVLKRFIDCAKLNRIDVIIRVCADNPFIDVEYIEAILNKYKEQPANYISFGMPDGTPTIKTHFGIFCELVELQSLELVSKKTDETLYREHVTNYIYANPELFSIKLIDIPSFLINQKIRLTLDTKEDFEVLSDLYKTTVLKYGDVSIKNVLKILNENPLVKELMAKEIEKNTK